MSTMLLGRSTVVVGMSTMVLGSSTLVLVRSTMVSGLVCSGLIWPEYYSISAADMFVLVHSNFDHDYDYYYYY